MFLAFVPIFLLLGASGESVQAYLSHRELTWTLDEETSSYSVALAEFLGDKPFSDPHPATTGPINWEESLATVLKRGRLLSVDLFGPDGSTLVRHFGETPPLGHAAGLPPDAVATLATQSWELGQLTGQGKLARFAAYSPLHNAKGTTVGYLAVSVDAGYYQAASALGKKQIFIGSGVSVLCGLFAILLVAGPVTRGSKELQASADRAATGAPLESPKRRLIQEMSDLGETFGTMGTLLGEAMDKTRQSLIENEQLRTSRDLAATYHSQFSQPQRIREGNLEIEARLVGDDPGGAFCGCRRTGNVYWIFTGTVFAADGLQQAVVGSAAAGYLSDALSRLPLDQAIAEVASVFNIESWRCARVSADGKETQSWTGTGAKATGTSESSASDKPLCLHTFPASAQHDVDTCLNAFSGQSASEIAENIHRLLGSLGNGALIVVQFHRA